MTLVEADELEAIKKDAAAALRCVAGMRAGKLDHDEALFAEGLRFWAQAVARRMIHVQVERTVEYACRQVPDFDGNALRWFEELFEGVTLLDGDVWP